MDGPARVRLDGMVGWGGVSFDDNIYSATIPSTASCPCRPPRARLRLRSTVRTASAPCTGSPGTHHRGTGNSPTRRVPARGRCTARVAARVDRFGSWVGNDTPWEDGDDQHRDEGDDLRQGVPRHRQPVGRLRGTQPLIANGRVRAIPRASGCPGRGGAGSGRVCWRRCRNR